MKVVHRPGRNLYPRLDRGRVEIEQAVGPTVRPGLHQGSNHLKIYIPALGVQFRSFFTQVQRAAPSYKDVLQYITETDNGPGPLTGPGADPGRSLRWSRTSAEYMLKLRQTSKAQG